MAVLVREQKQLITVTRASMTDPEQRTQLEIGR